MVAPPSAMLRWWWFAGLPCLCVRGHSDLRFDGAQGLSRTYVGKPAVWNAFLPNFGKPKLSYTTPMDRESYNLQPSFRGRVVINPADFNRSRSFGCEPLAAAPPHEAVAVLVDRGLCGFREKALNAWRAGYAALLLANSVPGAGRVPDMSAAPSADSEVELPGWSLSKTDGEALRTWLAVEHSLRLKVEDDPRRPALGVFQEDQYGLRVVLSV
mmetsp:Transcript_1816/g.3718  ORF Transcript_1816/g.3718 Transcript_1816/m.3718 type:complete len:213 (-) Transcript_1816:154-792(-)